LNIGLKARPQRISALAAELREVATRLRRIAGVPPGKARTETSFDHRDCAIAEDAYARLAVRLDEDRTGLDVSWSSEQTTALAQFVYTGCGRFCEVLLQM